MTYKYDCFAFRRSKQMRPMCGALAKLDCDNCPFYKTESQVSVGRAKALSRIRQLPEQVQLALIDKYGDKPEKSKTNKAM